MHRPARTIIIGLFYETGFLCVFLAVLELPLARLTMKSEILSHLSSAGIKSVYNHPRVDVIILYTEILTVTKRGRSGQKENITMVPHFSMFHTTVLEPVI